MHINAKTLELIEENELISIGNNDEMDKSEWTEVAQQEINRVCKYLDDSGDENEIMKIKNVNLRIDDEDDNEVLGEIQNKNFYGLGVAKGNTNDNDNGETPSNSDERNVQKNISQYYKYLDNVFDKKGIELVKNEGEITDDDKDKSLLDDKSLFKTFHKEEMKLDDEKDVTKSGIDANNNLEVSRELNNGEFVNKKVKMLEIQKMWAKP